MGAPMIMMSFGQTLRASRLGWGQLPAPRKGLLRLSPVRGGTLAELYPLGMVPNDQTPSGEHIVWWEDGKAEAIIAESPYLSAIRQVKQPFTALLGEDGLPVAKMPRQRETRRA